MVRAAKKNSSDSIVVTEPCIAESTYVPAASEVLSAVVSLYDDQLKPYSRIIRKRLVERAEARGAEGNDCDAARLRHLCDAFPLFRIEVEPGGEWSALLMDRTADFIDIYNPVDTYSEDLWVVAASYFRSLGQGGEDSLPGGRYASAQALAKRGLPFLRGYTLGQVCHIAQIAISQRKLLGYANGAVVPYEQSTSMLKSKCAKEHRPVDGTEVAADPDGVPYTVVDWETARRKMQDLLKSSAQRGSEYVPLSNVKRLFRSLFHMELSETSLGHSKLTDLLHDARFADICKVQLRNQGYVVVPARASGLAPAAAAIPAAPSVGSFAPPPGYEHCGLAPYMVPWFGFMPYVAEERKEVLEAPAKPPTLLNQKQKNRPGQSIKMDQKDSGKAKAQTYDRKPTDRACGSTKVFEANPPKAVGLVPQANDTTNERKQQHQQQATSSRIRFCQDEPLCVEEAGLAVASGNSPSFMPYPSPSPTQHPRLQSSADSMRSPDVAPARLLFCPDEPLCMDEAMLGGLLARSPGFPLPTPSPSPRYPNAACTPDRRVWEAKCHSLGLQLGPLKSMAEEEEDSPQHRTPLNLERVQFCADEPLCMEDAECPIARSPGFPLPTPSPSPMYPSSSMKLDKKAWEANLRSLGLIPLKSPESGSERVAVAA